MYFLARNYEFGVELLMQSNNCSVATISTTGQGQHKDINGLHSHYRVCRMPLYWDLYGHFIVIKVDKLDIQVEVNAPVLSLRFN